MTIGLFSDIHANLPALEAVLEDVEKREVDALYCLGDLVGYAPWSNEVVEILRARRIPTIAGNYDEGVGLGSDDCGCVYQTDEEKAHGAASMGFTNDIITDDNRRYIRSLPRHLRLMFQTPREPAIPPLHFLLVHGSPRRINEYLFEDRPEKSYNRMMERAEADVLCFGHTHRPFHKVLSYNDAGDAVRYRYCINTGSVGKPTDGDPRACYVLLHVDNRFNSRSPDFVQPEFRRVAYDVERTARGIKESRLPDAFAEKLRRAR